MPIVEFTKISRPKEANINRRSVDEVLGHRTGPSATGSSFYKSLISCPREHGLVHVAKYRQKSEKEALTVGVIFHLAMETYYEAIAEHQWQREALKAPRDDEYYFGGCPRAQNEAFAALEPFSTEPGYEKTYRDVSFLLSHYFDHYHMQDKWRIIAVEETLGFRGEFPYTARVDLIVEDATRGGMWIVELKSARAISEDLLLNYQMDLQILGQVWLMKHCVDLSQYPKFRGVIVNIGTKQVKPQFERLEVCPSDAHLAAFEESVASWHVLRKVYEDLEWPRALGACAGALRGYTRCSFYDLCHAKPEASVAQLASEEPPEGFIKV